MKRKSSVFTVIAVIISLGGIVFGIILGAVCKINNADWSSSPRMGFNPGLMFQTWIIADIIALAFYWMSQVLCKLENIEKALGADGENETLLSGINNLINNTKNAVSNQNVAGSSTSANTNTTVNRSYNAVPPENREAGANEWKCPNCGKINQNYVGSCGCGQTKP